MVNNSIKNIINYNLCKFKYIQQKQQTQTIKCIQNHLDSYFHTSKLL